MSKAVRDAIIRDYVQLQASQPSVPVSTILVVPKLLHNDVYITGDNSRQSDASSDGLGICAQRDISKGTYLEDDSSLYKSGTPPDGQSVLRTLTGYFDENMLSSYMNTTSGGHHEPNIRLEIYTNNNNNKKKLRWRVSRDIKKDEELLRDFEGIPQVVSLLKRRGSYSMGSSKNSNGFTNDSSMFEMDPSLMTWKVRELLLPFWTCGNMNKSHPIKICGARIDQKIGSGWSTPSLCLKMIRF